MDVLDWTLKKRERTLSVEERKPGERGEAKEVPKQSFVRKTLCLPKAKKKKGREKNISHVLGSTLLSNSWNAQVS